MKVDFAHNLYQKYVDYKTRSTYDVIIPDEQEITLVENVKSKNKLSFKVKMGYFGVEYSRYIVYSNKVKCLTTNRSTEAANKFNELEKQYYEKVRRGEIIPDEVNSLANRKATTEAVKNVNADYVYKESNANGYNPIYDPDVEEAKKKPRKKPEDDTELFSRYSTDFEEYKKSRTRGTGEYELYHTDAIDNLTVIATALVAALVSFALFGGAGVVIVIIVCIYALSAPKIILKYDPVQEYKRRSLFVEWMNRKYDGVDNWYITKDEEDGKSHL